MTKPILETRGFAAAVINALASNICVIDQNGTIIAVNRAWQNFSRDNPPPSSRSGVGSDYLRVCREASGPGSEEAAVFGAGITSVLNGGTEVFEMEYPCHSLTERRWFLGRATPLAPPNRGAVISHLNITDRKLLELELQRLAATDPLTGLPNRRYFIDAGNRETESVKRFGTPASLIMLDLDHFKVVNDTYGHAAGDVALRTLAKVCRKSLRKVDVMARIGGEEFAVILPGTAEAGALAVADKLRRALEAAEVRDGAALIPITASMGVAEIRRGDTTVNAGLRRADRALFAAKRGGRNCVVGFAGLSERAPSNVVSIASGRRRR